MVYTPGQYSEQKVPLTHRLQDGVTCYIK